MGIMTAEDSQHRSSGESAEELRTEAAAPEDERPAPEELEKEEPEEPPRQNFPIVGVGASAGGLEALQALFSAVSPDSGLAYLVLVHLSPDQPSMMDELLQKVTEVPVTTARDGETVRADHIYVTPSDKVLSLYQGAIQLLDPLKRREEYKPIDQLLRSLAQDHGRFSAAVILSGTGTDGSEGAKHVKEYEGTVLAQSEDSAQYNGMPGSAIDTGMVDFVLPPEEIPPQLERYFTHRSSVRETRMEEFSDERERWLNKILAVLRTQAGHDFYAYKKKTLVRRINRRMSLHQIEEYSQYLRFLRETEEEVEALFRELLIGVTHFFRDAESFQVLKEQVLPNLLEKLAEDEYLRAWIPGCSTGEEAYSLAMVLRESIDALNRRIHLQLFGTDIDPRAIEKARDGLYPSSIAPDVGGERLRRFFISEGAFYRVRKELRDSVVFSVQNVLKDPPFGRLHLLCCRNLLIYLESSQQKKLIPLFHYTLRPHGILMLGSSESIGGFSRLFDQVNKRWKIYRRREVHPAVRGEVQFPTGPSTEQAVGSSRKTRPAAAQDDLGSQIRSLLLEHFAPTAVLIDSQGSLLYIQGRTGRYLETGTGPPTQDIIDMARDGLRLELSSAIRKAASANEPVSRTGINIEGEGDSHPIDLHVYPLRSPEELAGKLLVVFQEREPLAEERNDTEGGEREMAAEPENRIAELERELQNTRESHQTTTEELESANEELKSTNEELQSSNEELQSTNEELESSKEELQSLNEELQTVNAELQSKVEELSTAQDDLRNLLNSTEIATIFVDNQLRVKRFTEKATELFNLIQSDLGRPLEHVTTNLAYDRMCEDISEVVQQFRRIEKEVRSKDGRWYEMRILPYRTADNRIDGAVLVFQDIDLQKQRQQELSELSEAYEDAWELVRSVFDMNDDPLAVTDTEGSIVIANTAFSRLSGIPQEELDGTDIFSLPGAPFKKSDLQSRMSRAEGNDEQSFPSLTFRFSTAGSPVRYTAGGRMVRRSPDRPMRVLLRFQQESTRSKGEPE
jgi:two-component system CheB/CheR fusion protein